jgi:predicted transposase YbfD/YdcC
MKNYKNPLHIVSAQLAEFGITLGQIAVESKSNEIPAVQELLKILDINGCLIVADALNCQTKTAEIIVESGADYLLSVKDNQPTLSVTAGC